MKSAQFIKKITKTDFLKNLGTGKDEFISKDTKGGIADILYAFGEQMVDDLAQKLSDKDKVASGDLISSMRFSFPKFGTTYNFVFTLEEYYKWVDAGRPKGKLPPFDAINKWANTKKNFALDTFRRDAKGRVIQKKFKTFSKVSRVGIIEAIRWGIYRKGIKPTNFWTSTVEDGRIAELEKDLSVALGKEVQVNILEYVKEIKKLK